MADRVAGAPVIIDKVRDALTEKQLIDWTDYKTDVLEWTARMGKEPEKAEGYSDSVVRQMSYQVSLFYRWLWEDKDQYTTTINSEDVTRYMADVAMRDTSNSAKGTKQKCMKRLVKYHEHRRGHEMDWEASYSFHEPHNKPRDFLTKEERKKVREAALDYDSIPSYHSVTPEERDEWKSYLAQRFGKPKEDVSPDDFERANGWCLTSLFWTTLDAGLRPVEVRRARVQWIDIENKMLRIPHDESSKGSENWTVAISDRTASALERWLEERKHYEKYDDMDKIWLSREGTPYSSMSLGRHLRNLCEEAGIPTENRQMSWYSIRHSVGTYMTREEDLAATQAQLRHKSPETTMKYDSAPVEDREDALDKMG
jgi:integrase